MRYAFLEQSARNLDATRIATAHNADDNLETMLLHLVRGSGLRGLTGIPPRRGSLVRPLLTTSRAEIEEELRQRGIPHVEDATNADRAYSENKLRLEVIPVLRELNPQLIRSAGETIAVCLPINSSFTAAAERAASAATPLREGFASAFQKSPRQLGRHSPPGWASSLWETSARGRPRGQSRSLDAVVALARGNRIPSASSISGGAPGFRRGSILFFWHLSAASISFHACFSGFRRRDSHSRHGWSVVCRRTQAPEVPPKSRLEVLY